MTHRTGLVGELRRSFAEPKRVAEKLALKVSQGRGSYVLVCCPAHGERNASCSLHRRNGTLAVKCWGCGFTGDVLTLVAKVHGLDMRRGFADVLAITADLAGRFDLLDEIRGVGAPERRAAPVRLPEAPPEPERDYPPADEIAALWEAAGSVAEDADAVAHLLGRKLDPALVARMDLARVLNRKMATDRLPDWATFGGAWWRDTGHRMLVRVYDSDGEWRSVRAWRIVEGKSPKRLPPARHKAAGLVLANERGARMLRGEGGVVRVIIVEGEPDFLTWSTLATNATVLGVLSGSWTEAMAARVPYGSEVLIRTHLDDAGEKYAKQIFDTVRDRAQVFRLSPTEERYGT